LPKFPEPPDLRALPPTWRILPAGTRLWRLYARGGPHGGAWNQFRSFGPLTTARFDHHLPPPHVQERAILYAALHGPTCIAEVFQDTRVIDRQANEPWLVMFETAQPLCLLDLSSTWSTQAGASMAIASGRRDRARRWSQAIFVAYPLAQGLWYPSSMNANTPCAALYQRAAPALPHRPMLHLALSDPRLDVPLQQAARQFNFRIVQ
jgi:hypothetical protein